MELQFDITQIHSDSVSSLLYAYLTNIPEVVTWNTFDITTDSRAPLSVPVCGAMVRVSSLSGLLSPVLGVNRINFGKLRCDMDFQMGIVTDERKTIQRYADVNFMISEVIEFIERLSQTETVFLSLELWQDPESVPSAFSDVKLQHPEISSCLDVYPWKRQIGRREIIETYIMITPNSTEETKGVKILTVPITVNTNFPGNIHLGET